MLVCEWMSEWLCVCVWVSDCGDVELTTWYAEEEGTERLDPELPRALKAVVYPYNNELPMQTYIEQAIPLNFVWIIYRICVFKRAQKWHRWTKLFFILFYFLCFFFYRFHFVSRMWRKRKSLCVCGMIEKGEMTEYWMFRSDWLTGWLNEQHEWNRDRSQTVKWQNEKRWILDMIS